MRSKKSQRTFLSGRPTDRSNRRRRSLDARLPPETPERRQVTLTPRQRDVAALLVETGLSYKQIAAKLHLSEGTIRTHTESIYRAAGVHSRPELTVVLRALAT